MHKKGAFDADPMRADAAHGKVFFDAATALTHDDALKNLNAFAVAFNDAKVHAHAVAGAEFGGLALEMFIYNGFNEIHANNSFPYPDAPRVGRKKLPRNTRVNGSEI